MSKQNETTHDDRLLVKLMRERRWHIERVLNGEQKSRRTKASLRLMLARINAEIARGFVRVQNAES